MFKWLKGKMPPPSPEAPEKPVEPPEPLETDNCTEVQEPPVNVPESVMREIQLIMNLTDEELNSRIWVNTKGALIEDKIAICPSKGKHGVLYMGQCSQETRKFLTGLWYEQAGSDGPKCKFTYSGRITRREGTWQIVREKPRLLLHVLWN